MSVKRTVLSAGRHGLEKRQEHLCPSLAMGPCSPRAVESLGLCLPIWTGSPVSSWVPGTYRALNSYLSLLNEGLDKQMSDVPSVTGAKREEGSRRQEVGDSRRDLKKDEELAEQARECYRGTPPRCL